MNFRPGAKEFDETDSGADPHAGLLPTRSF